jgi:glycine betaine/proline transport system substrate-binding protein
LAKTGGIILRAFIVAFLIVLLTVTAALAEKKPITIVHANWSSSVASATLVKAVLQERLGRKCVLVETDAENMWKMVAEGKADVMLSAWLPDAQKNYYKEYGVKIDDLGPNLEGTKIGLVVPKITAGRFTAGTGIRNRPYIDTESIPELKKQADKYKHRIIGIDSGSGLMHKTKEAIRKYDLTDSFRLISGSEVSMVAELSHAIRHQRWVVVTCWRPHWAFARWNLHFLDDPENVFGKSGYISTLARKGLKDDEPDVYKVLDKFSWTPEEMGQLMLWIQEDEGLFPYEKALRWMGAHPEDVNSWLQ